MTTSQRKYATWRLPRKLLKKLTCFFKVQSIKYLEKSLIKQSSFSEKMKKFRVCENRFKIAFSNRQTEVTHELGGISPLSWLITAKSHNKNYRYWLNSYIFIIVISNDFISTEIRYLTSPSQAASKTNVFFEVQFIKYLEKSLIKQSSFSEKMKKFRVCKNRFKIALLNRQADVTDELGAI